LSKAQREAAKGSQKQQNTAKSSEVQLKKAGGRSGAFVLSLAASCRLWLFFAVFGCSLLFLAVVCRFFG